MARPSYDVVIVGAGTTGCVLAARLSEDPSRRVLLLDAGRHYAALEDFPPELRRARSLAASMPGHPENWSFVGMLREGRPYPMARGMVVGGSSAINGGYFVRGRRSDFDEWAALGNDLWSYAQVLPCYVRSEHDLDFTGPEHGASGPIPVRRTPFEQMRPISQEFWQACLDAGFAHEPDKNAEGVPGIGPIPHNSVGGIRMNTALTHLAPCLGRPNLTVLGGVFVRRVLLENTRAVGVETERDGEPEVWRAGEVVLCAGALQSPHLLLVSGIGPADALARYGIEVRCDSPGVGRDVADNPSVLVPFELHGDEPPFSPDYLPLEACLNFTSPGSPIEGDLEINCSSGPLSSLFRRFGDRGGVALPNYLRRPVRTLRSLRGLPARFVLERARSRHSWNLMCSLEREQSAGRISLCSADPRVAPGIFLDYLADPGDVRRMREAVRTAVGLLEAPGMARLGLRRLGPTGADLATDGALDAWVLANLGTSFHTSGSARMGPESSGAVVDQLGRVYGIEALRVLDISIMPTHVRRGPAATAVMIGERAAALFG